MEAIGRVKHKTLVTSLGYCTEGPYRMLVSEYVDNGNLHHWLRDFPSLVNTLTWNMRLNIISGVARGLAYLHEEVEPKIIHGSIKSSNVLLDHQWSPKISDFDLAKLLGPDWSHVIMEALGYVAPDCHSSSTLTEGNDIYDFGILIMEIVSGKIPLSQGETLSLVANVDPEDSEGCISWWLVMEDSFAEEQKFHMNMLL
ncbi:hypothetical protein RIF29_24650 [Crotalaria pallida]|uniref:non-specific serine/threonine protein kinase n=1 Tax=Crotalaria pallida TaxID=3830 RepID=A0AAN9EKX7_CROPI